MKQHQKPINQGSGKRRKRVYVYLTEEQIIRLKEKAKAKDYTMSGLIVDAIKTTIDNQTVLDLKWEKGDFE